jgi:hypothetical protein
MIERIDEKRECCLLRDYGEGDSVGTTNVFLDAKKDPITAISTRTCCNLKSKRRLRIKSRITPFHLLEGSSIITIEVLIECTH